MLITANTFQKDPQCHASCLTKYIGNQSVLYGFAQNALSTHFWHRSQRSLRGSLRSNRWYDGKYISVGFPGKTKYQCTAFDVLQGIVSHWSQIQGNSVLTKRHSWEKMRGNDIRITWNLRIYDQSTHKSSENTYIHMYVCVCACVCILHTFVVYV